MFSKEQFTTVTPLSKALAMIVFITLPFAAFFLGMSYGQQSLPSVTTEINTTTDDVEEIGNNGSNGERPATIEEIYNSGLNEEPRIIPDPPIDFAGLIVKTASSYKRGDVLKVLVTNPTSDPLSYWDGPAGCTIHFERMVNGNWMRDFGVTNYDNSLRSCVLLEIGASESVEFSRGINLNAEPGIYRLSFIMGQSNNYSNTFEIYETQNSKYCITSNDCELLICSGCLSKEFLKTAPPDLACATYPPDQYTCECINNECTERLK